MLLNCSYNNQPFITIGWYVANEYVDDLLKENPPSKPILEKVCICIHWLELIDIQLVRTVQTTDVRITSFPIKWDDSTEQQKEDEATTAMSNVDSADNETKQIATDCDDDEVRNDDDAKMSLTSTKSTMPLSDMTNGDVSPTKHLSNTWTLMK